MPALQLRRTLPGIALLSLLMAIALACGASDEHYAELLSERRHNTEDSARFAEPPGFTDAAAADGSEVWAEEDPLSMKESTELASTPFPQAAVASAMQQSSGAVADASTDQSLSSVQTQSGRQLIVEGWINLEVDDIDSAARQVEQLATQRGGWMESANIVGEGGYRTASIGIRVPAERFDNAMAALREMGIVTDEGVSSSDVTDQLVDNEARIKAWQVQEERLIVLLENAASVEDVIEIEKRIAQVRADIESLSATQRSLENQVAASLIRVSLHLSARFAADPPRGSMALAVGNPAETANAIAAQVQGLQGYIGERRAYQQDHGQIIELSAYVKPTDLAGLMDYATTLGEPSERRLDSVGPAPAGDSPSAKLRLLIRSNVDSDASLNLDSDEPITAASQIRARAESLGGYVEIWEEAQHDEGKAVSVNMHLVVKASDLRQIMEFAASLGKLDDSEYRSAGQSPADTAPNSRLVVTVYNGSYGVGVPWGAVIAIIAGLVVVVAVAVVGTVWLIRRRRAANQPQPLLPDAAAGSENAAV